MQILLLINLVGFGIKSDKLWLASGILNASWNRWNIFSITRLLNCAAAENEADTREETRRYFLFAPYLSNPRDLDFFKRNICICCSPPFYFSLFALGATSLPEQVTCRIFHFLLLDQQPNLSLMNSMLANNIRIIDHHQVIQVSIQCGKSKLVDPLNIDQECDALNIGFVCIH